MIFIPRFAAVALGILLNPATSGRAPERPGDSQPAHRRVRRDRDGVRRDGARRLAPRRSSGGPLRRRAPGAGHEIGEIIGVVDRVGHGARRSHRRRRAMDDRRRSLAGIGLRRPALFRGQGCRRRRHAAPLAVSLDPGVGPAFPSVDGLARTVGADAGPHPVTMPVLLPCMTTFMSVRVMVVHLPLVVRSTSSALVRIDPSASMTTKLSASSAPTAAPSLALAAVTHRCSRASSACSTGGGALYDACAATVNGISEMAAAIRSRFMRR